MPKPISKKQIPTPSRKLNKNENKIVIDGNSAAATRELFMGAAQLLSWYPITPSSSVCESMIDSYMEGLRVDKATGKKKFAVLQAEDELAAIGMVLGAGWAGERIHDCHRRTWHKLDG